MIDCSPIAQQGPPGPTGEPGKTLINNNENVCLYFLCIQMLLYLEFGQFAYSVLCLVVKVSID